MNGIELKSPDEIDKMSRAAKIVAEVLEALRGMVKPGVTTEELDRFAEGFILERGGIPAFKGYRVRDKVYQHTLCTSVNNAVVHGIPSSRVLKEGDIIGLDLGVVVEGYYGDAAITVPVGRISEDVRYLLQVTKKQSSAIAFLTYLMPCKSTRKRRGSRSSPNLSGMALAESCMRSRKFPITGNPAKAPV